MPLRTVAKSDFDPSNMTRDEQVIVRRLPKELNEEYETSQLQTGKWIVEARAICEKYGVFWRWLKTLPFTERTAYRRGKRYERAAKKWPGEGVGGGNQRPEEVVEAAIKRRLRIIGWTNEKPMGFFENVPAPPKNLTPQKIEEYLMQA